MSGNVPFWRGFKITGRVIAGLGLASGCFPCAYATTFDPVLPLHADISHAGIGERIVAFAREQQGRQVGTGECTELAVEAMKRADAKDVWAYGETPGDGDYVWGNPVALKDAQPGDIVQFRNFTIKTTVIAMEMLPGGRYGNSESQAVETRDHHTAIVEQNYGGELLLLEQNVEPHLVVQRTLLPIASGTTEGSPDGTPGVLETTFEVAGVARIYRPQPAHAEPQYDIKE
jgi:hypothetical protein